MSKVTLFVKTYDRDMPSVKRLLNSIAAHNKDNLPLVVSVNPGQVDLFKNTLGTDLTIIDDREIFQVRHQMDGWRYQQAIKANYWRINPAPVYLAIDSDVVFLTDFYESDFMYDDDTPYTLMHESKDMLEIAARYKPEILNDIFYQKAQEEIRKIIPNKGPKWDWGPGPFIWANSVWAAFDEYLLNNNFTQPLRFDDFMVMFERNSGTLFSEYMLYGECLWYNEIFKVVPKQPLIKSYHWMEQFEDDFNRGVRASHIKHNYLGVGIQSNWAHDRYTNLIETFFNE